MSLSSVPRIGTWILGRVGRLWSLLAPRRSVNEIAGVAVDAVRSRELLDHVLLVDDQHLASLLRRFKGYFNESRPHQGINQRIPARHVRNARSSSPASKRHAPRRRLASSALVWWLPARLA